MTDILRSADCGNSPKNKLIEDVAVAMATRDTIALGELIADDIRWTQVGQGEVSGRDPFLKEVTRGGKATSVRVLHVTSHGRHGAVNLVITAGKKTIEACHVTSFTNTRGIAIGEIRSYQIKT